MKDSKSRWNPINSGSESQIINSILYFLSNYLWIVFFYPIVLYFKYVTRYQEVPLIKSFHRTEKWNSSLNPHIFGFVSDLHISYNEPNSTDIVEIVFQALKSTGVEKILVSGDISDNFLYKRSYKYGCQIEGDFIKYRTIESGYSKDFFIVASGNHDEFGVEFYNASDHYILKYCSFYRENEIYKNYENFLISKVEYDNIEIFVMNPYHYPSVPAGLGFSSDLTIEMLDKIESFLSSHSKKTRILITHYPTSFTNSWAKSSSHKTLADILSSSNLSLILCGDTHKELIIHTKKSLEIHATSIKKSKNSGGGYRFISIDNGGLNDQGFVIGNVKPLAVLTYPIMKKYISDQTDFSPSNLKQTEIRVVYFSENKNLNISVSCSSRNMNYKDIKTSFLKFQRIIRQKQSLYSTSLNQICNITNEIENEYHLIFAGDWNYEADFVSGYEVKLDKEILPKNLDKRKSIIFTGLFCYIIIFYIWCPFLSYECLENQEPKRKIEFFDIIFGFFIIRSRIYYNQSKLLRFVYFFFVLSPFFLPITLMKIGKNSYGFIYILGYYLNGFYVDLWGIQLTSYFVLFVLLPSTIVFSSISYFKETQKFNFVFIIDIIVALLQLFLIRIAIVKALLQSTSLMFAITSPLFVIIPIIIIADEIFQVFKINNNQLKNNNENQFLLDID